ncbi:DUF2884 family protein [Salinimonas marina]|uniref:DUF2884 family protein n=1 Tax=Salinimonas marina TaxID=2785918 RepID=A0A7S9DYD0_9ALTE|nr:DUF2884 family protein [Salinimonas marina]QPG06092.1 DUF2884 family protein [Salinimonas marina]
MKLTAIALLLLTTSSVLAHSDTDCDININGDLEYTPTLLTLTQTNGDVVTISKDHDLTINREAVSLTARQQEWVSGYYDSISEAVPLTMTLASDALSLANSALIETFGQLLGEDDELIQDFQTAFDDMRSELKQKFESKDGHFKITRHDTKESGWTGQAWASEFEQRIEDLAERATGRILMSLGAQMLSGEESMEDFGERMEAFGEDMEQRIEGQADAIETKAEDLCEILYQADHYENKLQDHVTGLEQFNILNVKSDSSKM